MFSRIRPWLVAPILALPIACSEPETVRTPVTEGEEEDLMKVQISSPLYPTVEYTEPYTNTIKADPVVVPTAQLTVITQQEVPSRVEGYVQFIGSEIDADAPRLPGREYFTHKRTGKVYRELKLGDTVKAGDVVGLLDDSLSQAEVARLDATLKGAQEDSSYAMKALREFGPLDQMFNRLRQQGIASDLEAIQVLLRKIEQEQQAATKQARVPEVEGELQKARLQLDMHVIHCELGGTVTAIYRRKGESIRNSENLLQIQNFDKLRVEGFVDRERAGQIEPGMIAEVEPSILRGPYLAPIGHDRQVTDMAVGFREGEPVLVTVSLDKTARVWQNMRLEMMWPHPLDVEVLAVDCTSAESGRSLVLTGAADGVGRIFDLATLKPEPLKELRGSHDGKIQAVAFSPDGKVCATASDRRDIVFWDVDSGEALYKLAAAHRGPVTEIRFTPQGRLVSVGRDNAVRVWELGKDTARLEHSFENRSGEVPHINVCNTGNQLLFDQSKSEMRVMNVKDGQVLQVIDGGSESDKFSEFACFSPDDRLVLTASGRGGLHLWRLPEQLQGRVTELRNLTYGTRASKATCGTFMPAHGDRAGAIVIGDQTGRLYAWPTPAADEVARRFKARITFVDKQIETSGQKLRVHAEFDNTGDFPLQPGMPVTLVVYPDEPGIALK